jgi:NAD-dependent deacetylase
MVAEGQRVVLLTGAGISTASGIPDYRGPDGVWTKNPGAEVRAHIDVWMSDVDVRRAGWQRRANMSWETVQPNAAHYAVADFALRETLDVVVTQNIDGLHQKAGLTGEQLIEIHGTVHESLCMRCGSRGPIELIILRVEAGDTDPRCQAISGGNHCDGILKAATISFGQSLVIEDLNRAERAARECDVFIAAGSTLGVYPIAAIVPVAHRAGAKIIIANGSPTEMDALADIVVAGDLTETLPAILAG